MLPPLPLGSTLAHHQDENNPMNSLSPEVQMNIRMDKIAGDCHSTLLPTTSKSPLRESSLPHSQGPHRHDKKSPTTTFCSHSTLCTRLHPAKRELGRTYYLLDDRLVSTRKLPSLPSISKMSKCNKNDSQLAIHEISCDALRRDRK
jgi:hypothetical protein